PYHGKMVVEVVVRICDFLRHFDSSVRSSELAQMSRNFSTAESITARPLYSMRSEPVEVTWPIWSAATPYCRAINCRAPIFSGARLTIQRAPRSLKSEDSPDTPSLMCTMAPSRGATCCAPAEEKQDS